MGITLKRSRNPQLLREMHINLSPATVVSNRETCMVLQMAKELCICPFVVARLIGKFEIRKLLCWESRDPCIRDSRVQWCVFSGVTESSGRCTFTGKAENVSNRGWHFNEHSESAELFRFTSTTT